ncbi:MAG: hypothetical protein RSC97_11185 [Eubacterium sp.]
MGIPLITVDSSALREYFSDDMVYCCKNVSSEGVQNIIKQILNEDHDNDNDNDNALRRVISEQIAFEENFTCKVLASKIIITLKN